MISSNRRAPKPLACRSRNGSVHSAALSRVGKLWPGRRGHFWFERTDMQKLPMVLATIWHDYTLYCSNKFRFLIFFWWYFGCFMETLANSRSFLFLERMLVPTKSEQQLDLKVFEFRALWSLTKIHNSLGFKTSCSPFKSCRWYNCWLYTKFWCCFYSVIVFGYFFSRLWLVGFGKEMHPPVHYDAGGWLVSQCLLSNINAVLVAQWLATVFFS